MDRRSFVVSLGGLLASGTVFAGIARQARAMPLITGPVPVDTPSPAPPDAFGAGAGESADIDFAQYRRRRRRRRVCRVTRDRWGRRVRRCRWVWV
jgi:hypothetical protein